MNDPGRRQRTTLEPSNDQIAPWADGILQNADDGGAEFLLQVAGKHGAANADHAGLELVHREERRRGLLERDESGPIEREEQG